jgi:mRNA-degrading endonuclease YafQ of YafQ-DinJ toxin-antitoxin module
MTQIAFSSSFKRAFKKRIGKRKDLEEKFWRRVEIFVLNPHDSRLRTHKLSGVLREQWSFTVEYDVRVVFSFLPDNRVVFEDIGSHDEVY